MKERPRTHEVADSAMRVKEKACKIGEDCMQCMENHALESKHIYTFSDMGYVYVSL